MWYGGSYRECNRKRQAQHRYSIIKEMQLTKENSFREIIQIIPFPPIIIARIRHLLHNEDFGRIMEGDYE